MNKRLSNLFLFLLFTFPVLAQQVKIGGVITDENGEPVELATVRIEGTAIGTVSNLKGKYSLPHQRFQVKSYLLPEVSFPEQLLSYDHNYSLIQYCG